MESERSADVAVGPWCSEGSVSCGIHSAQVFLMKWVGRKEKSPPFTSGACASFQKMFFRIDDVTKGGYAQVSSVRTFGQTNVDKFACVCSSRMLVSTACAALVQALRFHFFSFLLIPLKRNLPLQPIGKAHNSFPKSVGFFFLHIKQLKCLYWATSPLIVIFFVFLWPKKAD